MNSLDMLFNGDTSEVIEEMRRGTPAKVIPELAGRLGMTQDSLFLHLRLPVQRLHERICAHALLSATEQDRIYRTHRVWKRALEVFDDENDARRWINRDNRSLGGESPLALLDTEVGYELVIDTLGRIEYGIVL